MKRRTYHRSARGDPTTYADYIRDLVYRFREDAAEAPKAKTTAGYDHNSGREEAFIEAKVMQGQADCFLIPREECGLDGFAPLNGPSPRPIPATPSTEEATSCRAPVRRTISCQFESTFPPRK